MQLAVLVVSLTICAHAGVAQPTSDDSIVARFFPSVIDDLSRRLGEDPATARTCHFVRADLDGSGNAQYIVAAYGNHAKNVVRVIATVDTPRAVSDTANFAQIDGSECRPSVVDLDGDGRPEVRVDCSLARGDVTWLFKWDSGVLRNIGPVSTVDGFMQSHLFEPELLDIDGDGKVEIIPTGTTTTGDEIPIFGFRNGKYDVIGSSAFVCEYTRKKGAPFTVRARFQADAGVHVLRVINGPGGAPKVSSAVIVLNGERVVTPDDFSKVTALISKTVTPSQQNTLSVQLDGEPGSTIALFIGKE